MHSRRQLDPRSVFLNVPFDKSYEPLFVALISTLVALGRVPRCVLELPETGDGRLVRILHLIRSCPVSIHDLSRVGLPARFNMPFELGIAVALSRFSRRHAFVMLERNRLRLQKTLSDVNGIDPGIHGGRIKGVISCVLSHLGKPRGNPLPSQVVRIHRHLWKTVPFLKRTHGRSNVFSRAIFGELVEGAVTLARKDGLIAA
ncbi:MAG TPA: hypothetical protein VN281_21790 [Verrucomicrobiae bacterium]|jgi:hypothetical protein|nr:hypothetical protein [Verrucomicrobiae bacterium]